MDVGKKKQQLWSREKHLKPESEKTNFMNISHTHTQYKVLVYLVLILKIDFTNRHNWKIQAITSWKKILPQAQSLNIKYRLRLKVSSLNIRSKFLKKGNHLNLKGWTSKKCLSHISSSKKNKQTKRKPTRNNNIHLNWRKWSTMKVIALFSL